MQYVWLTIIAVSLMPVAILGFMLNPLVFWALGPEAWRDRIICFHPYRWWFVFFLSAFGTAMTVYFVKYG